jgi:glycosyltransferase involved in cell wall biosynthesis
MSATPEDAKIEAVVCIPTFRRSEHLKKTLASLTHQIGDVKFAVVVVENDAQRRGGKAVAEEAFASGKLKGLCVVETNQGNCFAINRAFVTGLDCYAEAEYLLMIDDDEVAAPSWLAEMVRAARQTGADIVGGPVLRHFDAPAERSQQLHPLFNSPRHPSGFVPLLFGSGNCLIARRVFEALDEPEFDLRFNFLGGGDMDFFSRCQQRGFKSYWNSHAVAVESVPAQRLATHWLLRRALTTGAINYTIDRKRHPDKLGYAALWIKNLLTLPLSLIRAARLLAITGHWLPASFPVLVSVGRSLAALGFAPTPYKA